MANEDYNELQAFLDDDGITLPLIRSKTHPEGKAYFVESPDFETGLTMQNLSSIAQRLANGIEVSPDEAKSLKFSDGAEEQGFAKMVLGDALDQMLADGVKWGPIRNATQYVFTYYAMSASQAKKLVQSAPKVRPPANRAERRAKKPKKEVLTDWGPEGPNGQTRFEPPASSGGNLLHAMLGEWDKIEADFQQVYGVDLTEVLLHGRRSWRWFKIRLKNLLVVESRIQHQFNPVKSSKNKG
ncbi:tail assembly chaperone [Microbacterium phage Cicada]|nr:tail assembly chaperone [Microbacterium phage Cicada]